MWLVVYAAVALPAAIVCAAALEWERRHSSHEDVRRCRRLPGVAGLAGGAVWPVVAVAGLACGLVMVIERSGRTVVDLIEGGG